MNFIHLSEFHLKVTVFYYFKCFEYSVFVINDFFGCTSKFVWFYLRTKG